MTSPTRLSGRCLCGQVRYRAGAALGTATYCHCASCRRGAGAHAVAWVTVATISLHYTSGEPAVFESSAGVRRSFCRHCGSPLTYWNAARGDEIDLTIGTLDDPNAIEPADHIWMEDAAAWDRPHDGLPAHARTRPGP